MQSRKGSNPIELASAWLDAAEHIPFPGVGVKTGKFLAKAGDTYLEHRRVQKVLKWFADRLPRESASSSSLNKILTAANTQKLEQLITSAISADLEDWLATSTDNAWRIASCHQR
jgi:hypothetical protein